MAIASCTRMNTNPTEPSDSRTFAIIGAAMEVHRVLGSGFLEVFYRDALAIEFGLRDIPFVAEAPCHVAYKGHPPGGGRVAAPVVEQEHQTRTSHTRPELARIWRSCSTARLRRAAGPDVSA